LKCRGLRAQDFRPHMPGVAGSSPASSTTKSTSCTRVSRPHQPVSPLVSPRPRPAPRPAVARLTAGRWGSRCGTGRTPPGVLVARHLHGHAFRHSRVHQVPYRGASKAPRRPEATTVLPRRGETTRSLGGRGIRRDQRLQLCDRQAEGVQEDRSLRVGSGLLHAHPSGARGRLAVGSGRRLGRSGR